MDYEGIANNILSMGNLKNKTAKVIRKENEFAVSTEEIYDILVYMSNRIASTQYKDFFILKGGCALMTYFIEHNEEFRVRRTVDLDIAVLRRETWDKFKEESENIFNVSTDKYIFRITKTRKPDPLNDSIEFEVTLKDMRKCKVKIDMQIFDKGINLSYTSTSLGMQVFDIYVQLVDKISTCVTRKGVGRRIKDLYDLYSIICVQTIEITKMLSLLDDMRPDWYSNIDYQLKPENFNQILEVYNIFWGIANKPNFDIVFEQVNKFLLPIIERKGELLWNKKEWVPSL